MNTFAPVSLDLTGPLGDLRWVHTTVPRPPVLGAGSEARLRADPNDVGRGAPGEFGGFGGRSTEPVLESFADFGYRRFRSRIRS